MKPLKHKPFPRHVIKTQTRAVTALDVILFIIGLICILAIYGYMGDDDAKHAELTREVVKERGIDIQAELAKAKQAVLAGELQAESNTYSYPLGVR